MKYFNSGPNLTGKKKITKKMGVQRKNRGRVVIRISVGLLLAIFKELWEVK